MFRRRIFFGPRPLLRRPRLIFGALAAGLGYAAGRSRGRGEAATPVADESQAARLRELVDLHERGQLTDEEFGAAKRELLGL